MVLAIKETIVNGLVYNAGGFLFRFVGEISLDILGLNAMTVLVDDHFLNIANLSLYLYSVQTNRKVRVTQR